MSERPRLGDDVLDPPGYDYDADMARQLREAGMPPDGRRPRPIRKVGDERPVTPTPRNNSDQ